MKSYYRIMLGRKSSNSEKAYKESFIGVNYGFDIDFTGKLPEVWREFNKEFIPVYLKKHPQKTKIAAGLACGFTYTVAKGIRKGDIVLCPNGSGSYYVGEVNGDYEYHEGEVLPHRRSVQWYPNFIERAQMSPELQGSTRSTGTAINITKYSEEIELLISGNRPPSIVATDESIEDPSVFALEKHLEDFLVKNWDQTSLGKKYDIVEEEGELVGQQYPTDTGPMDILAVSKNQKELLVIELKKGRASSAVVGQIQTYMGFAKDELAEKDQKVKGIIIALEDDARLRRALSVAQDIEFYTYKINFKLSKS